MTTRRLTVFSLLLTLALPALAPSASAQNEPSRGVLVYCDLQAANAYRVCPAEHWALLQEVYGAVGIPVEVAASLPDDLTGYRLVFVAIPGRPLAPRERSALDTYMRSGRVLALVGENAEYYGETLSNLNALLETLDVDVRFAASSVDADCGHTSFQVQPHRLTAGIEGYNYAYTTTVAGGVPLVLHEESGATLVAWERVGPDGPPNGQVVLFGDSNPFVDDCGREHTARLLRNMLEP